MSLERFQYSCSVSDLCSRGVEAIQQELRASSRGGERTEQVDAWNETVESLFAALSNLDVSGTIIFEFSIPRLGTRIDVLLIVRHVIFILEFKTGSGDESTSAVDQVIDYALDLRYFHETSRYAVIAPLLVSSTFSEVPSVHFDRIDPAMFRVLKTNPGDLCTVIEEVLTVSSGEDINSVLWAKGQYEPTPTIVEAARALFAGHEVAAITRSNAGAVNLTETSMSVMLAIEQARRTNTKAICFVTGVPGAGKTLVGLNLATKPIDDSSKQHCVYLSGNGPLVAVLREALIRDAHMRSRSIGERKRKFEIASGVKAFIQNVHHFRDEYLKTKSPPHERIVVFDEAQRAWNKEQTSSFMKRKKGLPNFDMSEPEYLISCMDRHEGWAVIVCLIGNGQEINTGEAGITEWLRALTDKFRNWQVYASSELAMFESGAQDLTGVLNTRGVFLQSPALHLSASVRSFRSEQMSSFVNQLLDFDPLATSTFMSVQEQFPIMLTRDVERAKNWVRGKARGSERYGILASSAAERLRPYAVDVTAKVDPVHWFLNEKKDVRSSYYLESVATEFAVQGLELDWTVLAWDADFRCNFEGQSWDQYSFRGFRWERVKKLERKQYQVNAYRVLLTRARQGMVIVVPSGESTDHTRIPAFYDDTFKYLESIGLPVI